MSSAGGGEIIVRSTSDPVTRRRGMCSVRKHSVKCRVSLCSLFVTSIVLLFLLKPTKAPNSPSRHAQSVWPNPLVSTAFPYALVPFVVRFSSCCPLPYPSLGFLPPCHLTASSSALSIPYVNARYLVLLSCLLSVFQGTKSENLEVTHIIFNGDL